MLKPINHFPNDTKKVFISWIKVMINIDEIWEYFLSHMNDHPTHMGVEKKGTGLIGGDRGLLWHFTRFSILKEMLKGRQVWLTDLTSCNDADEIHFGLRQIKELSAGEFPGWEQEHVRKMRHLAQRAVERFKKERHVYSFSLSEKGDTRQHWEAYGGGLQIVPDPKDPHIAIGFDEEALAFPIQVTDCDVDYPEMYLFRVATHDESIRGLASYWIFTTLKTFDKYKCSYDSLSTMRICTTLERMAIFIGSLIKNPGWACELEHRLLLVNGNFGKRPKVTCIRPDNSSYYVPLTWKIDNMPIKAIIVHPLANVSSIEPMLKRLPQGKSIEIISSELKPRPL